MPRKRAILTLDTFLPQAGAEEALAEGRYGFFYHFLNPHTGRRYFFDDIGCVVLWFKENKIAWSEEAVIWVNDAKTGEWIDARKAFYDTENITPMAYGFGAHVRKEEIKEGQEIVDFTELTGRVIQIGK